MNHDGVVLGEDVTVEEGAVLGKAPVTSAVSRAARGAAGPLVIGARTVIGAGAVVFAGARIGDDVVVGDGAHVREGAVIGDATVLGRGSALGAGVVVGSRVRLGANAWLTNGTRVEDDVVVGPGVVTMNDDTMNRLPAGRPLEPPTLLRGCRVGASAMLAPGVTVGVGAVVEVGSLVTRDVPDGARVTGVPARLLVA